LLINRFLIERRNLAWLGLLVWLSYSMGAIWMLEKQDIKIGKICSVAKR
jgi:hypothetical protein